MLTRSSRPVVRPLFAAAATLAVLMTLLSVNARAQQTGVQLAEVRIAEAPHYVNLPFALFTARRRGILEGVAAFPLSTLEGVACAVGVGLGSLKALKPSRPQEDPP